MGFILGLIIVIFLLKIHTDMSGLRARVEHMERYLEKSTEKL